MLSSEAALRGFDYLTDVRKFPDETVDGTVYLHYQGTYDYEKQLRSILESDSRSGRPPISNERMEKELEELRSSGRLTTTELWICRDDYLIRQM